MSFGIVVPMPNDICSIDGCNNPTKTRGWCGKHYMRWYFHGDPLTLLRGGRERRSGEPSCAMDGCEKPGPFVKGLCQMHYMRQWKYGDPNTVISHGGRPALAEHCRITGCDKPPPYVKGLCRSHYQFQLKYGDPLWEPPPKPPCSVEGCERISHVKGLCVMHYGRLREHGDTGEATPRRKAAGDGHIDDLGYHRGTYNGKKQKTHRYVMEQIIGRELLPDETVHHINGNRKDNRPENLELWTGMHGNGQRVEDLVEFVLDHYSELVEQSQARRRGT